MTDADADKEVTCHGIKITATDVMRLDRGRIISFVLRDKIRDSIVGHGRQVARSLTHFVLGLALVAMSMMPLCHVVLVQVYGGTIYAFDGYIVAFVVVGV